MAAPTFNLDAYTDALVLLGTAAIVVPVVQRWRVSPVLGYLVAGVILGPLRPRIVQVGAAVPAVDHGRRRQERGRRSPSSASSS